MVPLFDCHSANGALISLTPTHTYDLPNRLSIPKAHTPLAHKGINALVDALELLANYEHKHASNHAHTFIPFSTYSYMTNKPSLNPTINHKLISYQSQVLRLIRSSTSLITTLTHTPGNAYTQNNHQINA